MRIIGKNVSNKNYMVEISAKELSNLLGHYSEYDSSAQEIIHEAEKTGKDINIHGMYIKLRKLADDQLNILKVQKSLREMADNLEVLAPLLEVNNE